MKVERRVLTSSAYETVRVEVLALAEEDVVRTSGGGSFDQGEPDFT